MDLQQLATFRVIAALGSFTQAAEVMGFAQSTVSEHIKNLEADLQTRLFKRAGSKRVALTPAGERLLSYAQKMSNLEDEIKSEINTPAVPHGNLAIRIPETVSACYLPQILSQFHHLYPRVNLGFMNCVYFDLPEELGAGAVDLGFLITDDFQAPNLHTEILCPVSLVMVTGTSHPLTNQVPLDLSRLKDEPLIIPANDCSYIRLLERVLTEQRIKLPYVWRVNSITAIKQLLINGVGFSVLPEMAVRAEISAGSLAILPWQETSLISANLLMIWQKNKWIPPALQLFMQMVLELQIKP